MCPDLHYELTDQTMITESGEVLYRIRACADIPSLFVKAGDVGGWVTSALLPDGSPRIAPGAWVFEEAKVCGNAQVGGNARVSGSAILDKNTRVTDFAHVTGNARITDNAVVSDHARVHDQAEISGNAHVTDKAKVFDDASVSDHAQVRDFATLGEQSRVADRAVVAGCVKIIDSSCENDSVATGSMRLFKTTVSRKGFVGGFGVLRNSVVTDSARVTGGNSSGLWASGNSVVSATTPDDVWLQGNALIESRSDCVKFQPLSPDNTVIAVHRTADNTIGVSVSVFQNLAGKESVDVSEFRELLGTRGLAQVLDHQIEVASAQILAAERKPEHGVVTLAGGCEKLHQIRAAVVSPSPGVMPGDLGGRVESLTLDDGSPRFSHGGWVEPDAAVMGNAYVCASGIHDCALITDNVVVTGGSVVEDSVQLRGDTVVDNVWLSGQGSVSGDSFIRDVEVTIPTDVADVWVEDDRHFTHCEGFLVIRQTRNRALVFRCEDWTPTPEPYPVHVTDIIRSWLHD